MLHIVLLEPEIPPNTGNIARTCAATGTHLHLIEPLGFELSDRTLKRAGLDYWQQLTWTVYRDLDDFRAKNPQARPWMLSTKGAVSHAEVRFEDGDFLMFGRETKGLPEALLDTDPRRVLRIPMKAGTRSLNLSNSAAIVLFEALRQLDFPGLE